MKTGLNSSKIVIVGFIIPFLFVFHPSLLLQGEIRDMIVMTVSTGFSVVAFSAFFGRFLYRKCLTWERAALLASAILMITPGFMTDITGFVILAGIYFWQRRTAHAAV